MRVGTENVFDQRQDCVRLADARGVDPNDLPLGPRLPRETKTFAPPVQIFFTLLPAHVEQQRHCRPQRGRTEAVGLQGKARRRRRVRGEDVERRCPCDVGPREIVCSKSCGVEHSFELEPFRFQHVALASRGTWIGSPTTAANREYGKLIVSLLQVSNDAKRFVAIAIGTIGRPDMRAIAMIPDPATAQDRAERRRS